MPLGAMLAILVLEIAELARAQSIDDFFYPRDRNILPYNSLAMVHGFYNGALIFALTHLVGIAALHRRWSRLVIVLPLFLALNVLPVYGGVPMLAAMVMLLFQLIAASTANVSLSGPSTSLLLMLCGGGLAFGAGLRLAARSICGRGAARILSLPAYLAVGLVLALAFIPTDTLRTDISAKVDAREIASIARAPLLICLLVALPAGMMAARRWAGRSPARREFALAAIWAVLLLLVAIQTAAYLVDRNLSLSNMLPVLEPASQLLRALRPLER